MGGRPSFLSPRFKIASVSHKYHMKFIFQWCNKEIKDEEAMEHVQKKVLRRRMNDIV
jgi:hypothetical protein